MKFFKNISVVSILTVIIGVNHSVFADSLKPCDVPVTKELKRLNMGSYNSPASSVGVKDNFKDNRSFFSVSQSNGVSVDFFSPGGTFVRYTRIPGSISEGGDHSIMVWGVGPDLANQNATIHLDDNCNVTSLEILYGAFGAYDANPGICKKIKNKIQDSEAMIASVGQFKYQQTRMEQELLCDRYFPEIMK